MRRSATCGVPSPKDQERPVIACKNIAMFSKFDENTADR
jgi:hypothetical protein